MYPNRKKAQFRLFILVLTVMLMVSAALPAAAMENQSRASRYLTSYSAYTYAAGGGKVRVCFEVVGVNYMDEIGALTIELYDSTDNTSWRLVKRFQHTAFATMLGYNDYFHGSYVEYPGTAGRYYKAYVCIWAGKDGGGDSRYFWTTAKLAT